jgi:cysteinyl-tRNA synthetase
VDINAIEQKCYEAMCDDFNSPILIAQLFDVVRIINSAADGKESLTQANIDHLKKLIQHFVFDVMGLKDENASGGNGEVMNGVMQLILEIRNEAKTKKDFAVSDKIRNQLNAVGITIKDSKDGSTWEQA